VVTYLSAHNRSRRPDHLKELGVLEWLSLLKTSLPPMKIANDL